MTIDEIKKRIVYEDNHLLAFDKPSGTLVQPNQEGEEALEVVLKDFIKHRDAKPGNVFLGVIHRLDRPVSGLVVFAKTSKSLARMNELFKLRDVEKTYCALVKNKPPHSDGIIESFLLKESSKNITKSYNKEIKGSKPAKTYYELLGNSDSYFLLKVIPYTGRHHQIRVHLAKIGCPISGDLKYGSARSNKDGSISLHSKSLKFIHPIKNEIVLIDCPLPESGLWKFFKE